MIVVVAIIIILLALLVPTLSHAMERARLLKCSANLRTIQAATMQFAEDHDDMMPPSDVRPWAYHASIRDQMQEDPVHRWWHRWSSILMKTGHIDPATVPMGGPIQGWPFGSSGEEADQLPVRGQSPFICPSGTWEYEGPGHEGGSNHWNPIANKADKQFYAIGDEPHGDQQLNPQVVYVHYPVHYGCNGSNASSAYAMERTPSGGQPRLVYTGSFQNPSALIIYYDGRFNHNRTSIGRVAARHMNRTMANFSFADGHVRAFDVRDLPSLGVADQSLYPNWRR